MMRKMIRGLLSLALLYTAGAGTVAAQPAYPAKPIELVVASGAGGATDTTMRILSKYMAEKKKVTLNVVNKTGGGFVIGINYVLNAAPDGYTLMADTHGFASMFGAYSTDLPFDWRKRTYIARISTDVVLYLVKADSPWKTLDDVASFAKANPEKFRWGIAGLSGIGAPASLQFFEQSGIPTEKIMATQVSFKGGAESVTALAGGHVDFAAQQLSESLGMIAGNKVRALAVVSDKRVPQLADVPTAAEVGYPKLDVFGWHGISGPAGLPAQVQEYWAKTMSEASNDPVFIEMLLQAHKIPAYLDGANLNALNEYEYTKYMGFAKSLGIRK